VSRRVSGAERGVERGVERGEERGEVERTKSRRARSSVRY